MLRVDMHHERQQIRGGHHRSRSPVGEERSVPILGRFDGRLITVKAHRRQNICVHTLGHGTGLARCQQRIKQRHPLGIRQVVVVLCFVDERRHQAALRFAGMSQCRRHRPPSRRNVCGLFVRLSGRKSTYLFSKVRRELFDHAHGHAEFRRASIKQKIENLGRKKYVADLATRPVRKAAVRCAVVGNAVELLLHQGFELRRGQSRQLIAALQRGQAEDHFETRRSLFQAAIRVLNERVNGLRQSGQIRRRNTQFESANSRYRALRNPNRFGRRSGPGGGGINLARGGHGVEALGQQNRDRRRHLIGGAGHGAIAVDALHRERRRAQTSGLEFETYLRRRSSQSRNADGPRADEREWRIGWKDNAQRRGTRGLRQVLDDGPGLKFVAKSDKPGQRRAHLEGRRDPQLRVRRSESISAAGGHSDQAIGGERLRQFQLDRRLTGIVHRHRCRPCGEDTEVRTHAGARVVGAAATTRRTGVRRGLITLGLVGEFVGASAGQTHPAIAGVDVE